MNKKIIFALIAVLAVSYVLLIPFLGKGGIIFFGIIFGLPILFFSYKRKL
jgi:hypothetical protein